MSEGALAAPGTGALDEGALDDRALRALLAEATGRGLLSAEQAEGVLRLRGATTPGPSAAHPPERPSELSAEFTSDDERLRLVTGFADIFVTLGLALFLGAATWFLLSVLPTGGAFGAVAALAWALAEFFTRRRRMALPSIALLVAFAGAAFWCAYAALGGGGPWRGGIPVGPPGSGGTGPAILAAAALATALLVALHYRRFRVPITVAAGAAALIAAALGLVAALAPDFARGHLRALVLAAGLAAFAAAMRFDLSDPDRVTRRADVAFWLHLLAASLVVHATLGRYVSGGASLSPADAATVLAAFVALAVVAVLVDRRAALVSGLAYAGYALSTLARGAGLAGETVPLTALVLGAFVLLLSAGWRPLRRALLAPLPRGLAARLPHPR